MEYIIIFILFIFLIIVILIKPINTIKKFNNKINNLKEINTLNFYNKYMYYHYNPILLYLYENLYESLKKINKYDSKSYIIFNKLNISTNDKLILDWISYTGGVIRMSIDSIIKIIKKNDKLNDEFVNNIAKLKLFYQLFYKNINESVINKNIKKYIHNKKLYNNKVLFNLFYINEILKIQSTNYFNSLDKSDISKNIKNVIKDANQTNNYYLYNSFLNNRIKKIYICDKISEFSNYFNIIK